MDNTVSKQGRYKFITAWKWPGEVEAFIRTRVQGFCIHVCGGSSSLGDVTIDHYMPATITGDMYALPVRTGIADTVICDPPWGIPRHKRHVLLFELRRILKPGGTLIWNCKWLPRVPGLELDQVWVSTSMFPNNDCGLIAVCHKTQGSLFNDR